MEYRAGIFCGEVEVVLSNSNYGIEFLKLFGVESGKCGFTTIVF
jgi:hypothetical protein